MLLIGIMWRVRWQLLRYPVEVEDACRSKGLLGRGIIGINSKHVRNILRCDVQMIPVARWREDRNLNLI